MRWAWLVVLLGGCDLVFQLEERTKREFELIERRLVNDSAGVPFAQDSPFDPTLVEVRAFDGSGSEVSVEREGDLYTFLANGRYRVIVTLLGGDKLEYQLDADHARVVPQIFRTRAGFETATANTALSVDMKSGPVPPPPVTGDMISGYSLFTTGVDIPNGRSLPTVIDSFTYPWTDLPLVDGAKGDRLYVVHSARAMYGAEVGSTTDYTLELADLKMLDKQTTTVMRPLVAVPPSKCAHIVAPRADEIARVRAEWGVERDTLRGANWVIGAWTPKSNLEGLVAVAASGAMDTNVDLQVMYGDLYRHTARVLVMRAGVSEQVKVGTTTNTFLIETRQMVPLGADCNTPTVLASPPAIATNIALAGTALDVDDKRIRLDRRGPVAVTWDLTEGERGTYLIQLIRLPSPELVAAYVTNEPSLAIPESELDSGSSYAFTVSVLPVTPGAATGDLRPDGYASFSTRFSRWFKIEN